MNDCIETKNFVLKGQEKDEEKGDETSESKPSDDSVKDSAEDKDDAKPSGDDLTKVSVQQYQWSSTN